MNIRLLNRLLYLYLPFILLSVFYVMKRIEEPFDEFYTIDGMWMILLPFLIGVCYQSYFFLERRKIRNAFLDSIYRDSIEVDKTNMIQPWQRILNIYVSNDDRSVSLFKNHKLIFEFKKEPKIISLISSFRKRVFHLNDVRIIVMEFDKILRSMPEFLTDQSVYVCSFSIVTKNEKTEHLFNMIMIKKLFDNQDDFTDKGLKNLNAHGFFLQEGLKLLRILSNTLHLKYNYIDYVKKHSKNIIPSV